MVENLAKFSFLSLLWTSWRRARWSFDICFFDPNDNLANGTIFQSGPKKIFWESKQTNNLIWTKTVRRLYLKFLMQIKRKRALQISISLLISILLTFVEILTDVYVKICQDILTHGSLCVFTHEYLRKQAFLILCPATLIGLTLPVKHLQVKVPCQVDS